MIRWPRSTTGKRALAQALGILRRPRRCFAFQPFEQQRIKLGLGIDLRPQRFGQPFRREKPRLGRIAGKIIGEGDFERGHEGNDRGI